MAEDARSWVDAVLRGEIFDTPELGDEWWNVAPVDMEGVGEGFLSNTRAVPYHSMRPPLVPLRPRGTRRPLRFVRVRRLVVDVWARTLSGPEVCRVDIVATGKPGLDAYRATVSSKVGPSMSKAISRALSECGVFAVGSGRALVYDWETGAVTLDPLCVGMLSRAVDMRQNDDWSASDLGIALFEVEPIEESALPALLGAPLR